MSFAGQFDIRIHFSDQYGTPCAKTGLHVLDEPISPLRRVLLLIFITASAALFQHFLNDKGECAFLDPHVHTKDIIDDYYVSATAELNKYLVRNPHMAEAYQATCSLLLDTAMLFLLYVGTTRRSSVRPFVSLFLFMFMRFLAQIAAVIPCAPGFLWPEGSLFGYKIPTVFVDYRNANDMFFSGHAGTTLVIGLELFELDYHNIAWFQIIFALPYISTWVVAARAHRGIDVIAGILAAIAACGVSKEISNSIDRQLQVSRRIRREAIIASPMSPVIEKSSPAIATSARKSRKKDK